MLRSPAYRRLAFASLVPGVRVNSDLDESITDLAANGAWALVAALLALAVWNRREGEAV